jgi:hypothetical protein
LKKYGVNLPASKVGEPIKQPQGVTQAQYAAARAKCRGLIGGGVAAANGTASVPNPVGGTSKGGHRQSRPVSARALVRLRKFAACMRENGVNLPTPTASQPLYVPKGVNLNSQQFKAAELKCLSPPSSG